eukprot:11850823-Ditylum_brightwellii.AAC.1
MAESAMDGLCPKLRRQTHLLYQIRRRKNIGTERGHVNEDISQQKGELVKIELDFIDSDEKVIQDTNPVSSDESLLLPNNNSGAEDVGNQVSGEDDGNQ